MVTFKSKLNGKNVSIDFNFENMLEKNVNLNMHSYVYHRIALKFRKSLYAKLFLNMHQRPYLTTEHVKRRSELSRDMLGEIRSEYGDDAIRFLKKFI